LKQAHRNRFGSCSLTGYTRVPLARVAKLAASFDAQAEIVAEDGRAASARSPISILGLGLRTARNIVIRAGGSQAGEAVAAMVELIGSGMGELQPLPDSVPTACATDRATG